MLLNRRSARRWRDLTLTGAQVRAAALPLDVAGGVGLGVLVDGALAMWPNGGR